MTGRRNTGFVYQDRAPYEVLSTKWLTYAEVIRLKQIEEMVEVYYNSGQFCCTMAALEQEFASPFCMYECLAAYYDEKNAFAVSHYGSEGMRSYMILS